MISLILASFRRRSFVATKSEIKVIQNISCIYALGIRADALREVLVCRSASPPSRRLGNGRGDSRPPSIYKGA
jgi:hypothetical protein